MIIRARVRKLGFPVEGLFLDFINKAHEEKEEEKHHGAEDQMSMLSKHVFVNYSPGVEKNHLNVEENEKHGD
jgi:hypothetical protein